MKSFSNGFQYLVDGFRLIREPKLRLYVVIPLITNTIVFALFFYTFGHYFSELVGYFVGLLPEWLPEWLSSILQWLMWIIFGFLVIMILVYGFVFVATLIAAPFYSILAEQVQKKLTGKPIGVEMSVGQLVVLVPKTVGREVAKLLYYLPRALGLLMLSLVPLINTVSPILWGGFSAWMMALEFLDYPADNNQRSLEEVKQFMRKQQAQTFGFGLGIWAASLVPILNLFALQAAVAGGVKFWVENGGAIQLGADGAPDAVRSS